MKLKLALSNCNKIKNSVASILHIRKQCVLRFTSRHFIVISSVVNEPQIWLKFSCLLFDEYEIESANNNQISMECNLEQLCQVLRNFDKVNSSDLTIRLQRVNPSSSSSANSTLNGDNKANNGLAANINNKKFKNHAILAVFYSESQQNIIIHHTFKIPVRLLKKKSDLKIVEPEINKINLLLKLPGDFINIFKRIERFKSSKYKFLKINADEKGNLNLILKSDTLIVKLGWNSNLLVQKNGENYKDSSNIFNPNENNDVSVVLRLNDFKSASKICQICNNTAIIMSEPNVIILHLFIDESDDAEFIFYINGVIE
ncbi:Mec3p ASCRUDRAFT_35775 [Ascoidea rubescens DSM 1968]|uniref:Checkpoint protein n=1 Tax=Ascoidea rubescens DSM 1968 TaxID=1344418 RepID=A0A1D2VFK0_9ASCO|nr:hypothetical protein ASCRUDRAFT_35775 [Ascoidea rubescens DSM 1968]ODV60379.1 hypothetical protein ASCRUDRAFT_35775 [Ascoidea rubescens DSM 1968]